MTAGLQAKGSEAAKEASQTARDVSKEPKAKDNNQSAVAELDSAGGGSTATEAHPPQAEAESIADPEGDEEDEDEEGCAFCKFMKGGGCKSEFVAWEKCVADSRESGDFVGQCADITEALQACMNRPDNKDYYQLFLDDQEEYVREQRERDQQETEASEAGDGSGQGSDTGQDQSSASAVAPKD